MSGSGGGRDQVVPQLRGFCRGGAGLLPFGVELLFDDRQLGVQAKNLDLIGGDVVGFCFELGVAGRDLAEPVLGPFALLVGIAQFFVQSSIGDFELGDSAQRRAAFIRSLLQSLLRMVDEFVQTVDFFGPVIGVVAMGVQTPNQIIDHRGVCVSSVALSIELADQGRDLVGLLGLWPGLLVGFRFDASGVVTLMRGPRGEAQLSDLAVERGLRRRCLFDQYRIERKSSNEWSAFEWKSRVARINRAGGAIGRRLLVEALDGELKGSDSGQEFVGAWSFL